MSNSSWSVVKSGTRLIPCQTCGTFVRADKYGKQHHRCYNSEGAMRKLRTDRQGFKECPRKKEVHDKKVSDF